MNLLLVGSIFLLSILICQNVEIFEDKKYHCKHDEIKAKWRKRGHYERRAFVKYNNNNKRRSVDDYEPIRLKIVDTTALSDLSGNPNHITQLTDIILPKAKEYVEKVLKVIPIFGNLIVPSTPSNCGFTTIPGAHKNPGITDTDTVIYVSARSTDCSGSTLAFASGCWSDTIGRPFVGHVNICPNSLNPSESTYRTEKKIMVIVHEIFHALGFNGEKFEQFVDENGDPLGASNVILNVAERGHNVKKLKTPTVLAVARQHFGCPTLNGVEIEDGGGEGTSGSHVDMRLYQYDLMAGYSAAHPIISDISLAVLHDSGWYKANFTQSSHMTWGKNAGCDFALEKCLGDPKSEPVVSGPDHHFCKVNDQCGCTADRRSIGYCKLGIHQDVIPSHFQYFQDDKKGGSLPAADYCPYYTQVQFDAQNIKNSDCNDEANTAATSVQYYGEEYGSYSKCLMNNLRNIGLANYETLVGKCFKIECSYDPNILTVYIHGGRLGVSNEKIITCNEVEEGALKNPGGNWIGNLKCPKFDSVCLGEKKLFNCPANCSGNGNLSECVCTCNQGWAGDECEYHTCYNIAHFETDDVCSGNGVCSSSDNCTCNDEYDGDECEIPICYSKVGNLSCSWPNGTCKFPNNCDCTDGIMGIECDIDISDLLEEPELWDSFEGADKNDKCGSISGNAIYFGGNFTKRKIVQKLRGRGNFTLKFYFAAGIGNSDCNSSDSVNNNIQIEIIQKKSIFFTDQIKLLTLNYTNYSNWSNITVSYYSHFPHYLIIHQPHFIDFKDEWSVSNLDMDSLNYTAPISNDTPFVPPTWTEDLLALYYQYEVEVLIGLGIAAIVLIVLICVCCTLCFFCLCKRNNKIYPNYYNGRRRRSRGGRRRRGY